MKIIFKDIQPPLDDGQIEKRVQQLLGDAPVELCAKFVTHSSATLRVKTTTDERGLFGWVDDNLKQRSRRKNRSERRLLSHKATKQSAAEHVATGLLTIAAYHLASQRYPRTEPTLAVEFSEIVIAPGATASLMGTLEDSMQVDQIPALILESEGLEHLDVHQIRIGTTLLMAGLCGCPAEMFRPDAVELAQLSHGDYRAGETLCLTVMNCGPEPITVGGKLVYRQRT